MWWYLPQRLLPPHASDDETEETYTDMSCTALRWIGSPNLHCGRDAAQEQEPEDHREPKFLSVNEERQGVGQRIVSHIVNLTIHALGLSEDPGGPILLTPTIVDSVTRAFPAKIHLHALKTA
jgi:hypothetical protein